MTKEEVVKSAFYRVMDLYAEYSDSVTGEISLYDSVNVVSTLMEEKNLQLYEAVKILEIFRGIAESNNCD